jgi:cation diffusion facilitator family transporter
MRPEEPEGTPDFAAAEKRSVALSSVAAAIFLTALKLVVGLWTGSLGILAEAAHSGLDLAAAGVTYLAVRVSDQPADQRHTYGHGKVENLSALFETLLLFLTCIWIIYEAIQRLFFEPAEVQASIWAFLVMAVSIIIDVSRSRALMHVADKYNSQALEADALHFSTDIWSSSVVIVGLIFVRIADALQAPLLAKADAVAALGVAAIVILVSYRLGKRAVDALLDAAPQGLREQIMRAAHVPGVLDVREARVRQSGPMTFADLTLAVQPETSIEHGHRIADQAEAAVSKILPESDVMVHVEPEDHHEVGDLDKVRIIAEQHGMNAHALRLIDLGEERSLELHLEVDDAGRLDEAHGRATAFEREVRERIPGISSVVSHIEPMGAHAQHPRGAPSDEGRVMGALRSLEREMQVEFNFHKVQVRRVGDELMLSLHCELDPGTDLHDAHSFSEQLELGLRARIPQLARVIIHVEPIGAPDP